MADIAWFQKHEGRAGQQQTQAQAAAAAAAAAVLVGPHECDGGRHGERAIAFDLNRA
jgi:hypothetical protein